MRVSDHAEHSARAFSALIEASDALERARMAASQMGETKPDLQQGIIALQFSLRHLIEEPRTMLVAVDRGTTTQEVPIRWPAPMSGAWLRRVIELLA